MIRNVQIAGMGALGMLFGKIIMDNVSDCNVSYLLDDVRYDSYCKRTFTINGEVFQPDYLRFKDAQACDLLMIASKYTGLKEILSQCKNSIGKDTIIISLINGTVSEEVIAEYYGYDHIVWCVAQGMDAVKLGDDMTYSTPGQLRIGMIEKGNQANLDTLITFFEEAKVPYFKEEDIMYRMWSKFMLNVGINQVCAILECGYGDALHTEKGITLLRSAMEEAKKIANAEGIGLTERDIDDYIALMDTLEYDAMPSMRQDMLNHKKTEVELFATTVIRYGKKHGIDVPVNTMIEEKIREMEKSF